MSLTSWSNGRHLCSASIVTRTAAYRIGQTRNRPSFLGSNCTFRTGEGNRYLWTQSPVRTSQMQTLLSVEAESSCKERVASEKHPKEEFFIHKPCGHPWTNSYCKPDERGPILSSLCPWSGCPRSRCGHRCSPPPAGCHTC